MDKSIESKLKKHAERILDIDFDDINEEINEIEDSSLNVKDVNSKLLNEKYDEYINEMDVEQIISETVEIQQKLNDLEKEKINKILDSKKIDDHKKRKDIISKLDQNRKEELDKRKGKLINSEFDIVISSNNCDENEKNKTKEPVDGKFHIEVSEDKMTVMMTLDPPIFQGKPIKIEDVMKKLTLLGIEFGIKKKEIEKCVKFVNSKKEKLCNIVVSEGVQPENGKNAKIKFISEFINADEFELVDEKTKGKVALIKNGDLLISYEEATMGIKGTNVFGEKLEVKNGTGSIITGDNVIEQRREGVTYYHALIDGIAHYENNTIEVIENKNSLFDISISDDKMEAHLIIKPGTGFGRKIKIEEVFTKINENKVHLNTNQDNIKKEINQINNGDEIKEIQLLISKGKKPINGENGKIEFHVKIETKNGFHEDDQGKIDYRIKDNVINIDKETKLFTIHPATKAGDNGYDVFKNVIIADDGNPVKIEIGDNIREVEAQNCKVYYSLIDGRIFFDKLKSFVNVRKVMTVDNVDLDSGNIKFNGDLFVRGNIADNMEVSLEGDLFVKGNIGAAEIFVKGNLKCEGGIVNRHKARVVCNGNIFSKFIENSSVDCLGDILVRNAILNSEVKSNRSIVVKGEKGFIIGGSVYAKKSLKAISIGSSHGIKTEIHLGNDFVINSNYSNISLKRIKLEDKYNNTTELINKLFKIKKEVSEFSDDMKSIYKKSLAIQVQLREKIIELKSIEVKLLAEINTKNRCELIIEEKLYSDVIIFFGEKSFIVRNNEFHISYYRESGTDDIHKKILM